MLFALVFGLGFFGWVFLATGWFASGDEQIHRVVSAVLGRIRVDDGSAPARRSGRRPSRIDAPLDRDGHHGIGVVLMGALVSKRTQGWRIVAWLTGLGSIVYGVASVVFATYPRTSVRYPGSEGSFWGSLAVVWGVVFIAVAERRARAA